MSFTLPIDASGTRSSSFRRRTPLTDQVAEERPFLTGEGPAECSSCTDLALRPYVCFDVNGYYREMGVHWKATRRQLMRAYQALDGQSSVRLTYIFQQLLNPTVRYEYDCTPLGEVFMDRYVQDELNRKMRDRMSAERRRLFEEGEAGWDDISDEDLIRDIYKDMGFDAAFDDTPPEVVDGEVIEVQDEGFRYSYYLWRTRGAGHDLSADLMQLWQHLLIQALSAVGIKRKFSVGLMGRTPSRYAVAEVGYRLVIFMNVNDFPNEEMAAGVAKQLSETATPTLTEKR